MDQAVCPWSTWKPATISFCERELCAWVTQPANTWSNLPFIIVGFYLIWLSRKENQLPLVIVGISEILVGIGSFMFHMSSTYAFHILDVAAMFLISALMLSLNLRRFFKWGTKPLAVFYFGMVLLSTSIMIQWEITGIPIFATQVFVAVALEVLLFLRDQETEKEANFRYLFAFSALFAISFFVWNMDIRGIWCDPDNHWIQGHAVWHLFNAICIYFIYKFHSQFKYELKG